MSADAGSGPEARSVRLLAIVSAIAVVPRILAAVSDPIGYDGYWHVFIARNLAREYRSLAHPPLFPLLLKACDAIHPSRLSYEAVSLAAGCGAVFLFGRALQKLRAQPDSSMLAALALAFSPSAIRMSSVVESYMLCIFFILAAFLAYVDLLRTDRAAVPVGSRVAFAAYTTLALLSHYFAALFFAACLAAPFLIALVRPPFRRALRRASLGQWAVEAATFLPPAVVGTLLFWFLARPWVRSLNHLPEFYFRPESETAGSFVIRNLAGTFNLFSPVTVSGPAIAIELLVAFGLVAFLVPVLSARPQDQSADRLAPSAIFLLLLVIGIVGGLAGRYPFGGAMRHQLLLMLFGLLAAFIVFDSLLAASSGIWRPLLIAACLVAIGANSRLHLREWWLPAADLFEAQTRTFDRTFPRAREVHVDQFNLIGFFAQHHDWDWRFLGHEAANPYVERYGVSRAGVSLTLVAHRDIWNMDFRDPTLYRALAGSRASRCLDVFCVRQQLPSGPPAPEGQALAERIARLANQAGLRPGTLVTEGGAVFGEFCVTGAARNGPPPRLTSVVPSGTREGAGFQVQPNGESAISVNGEGFQIGAVVTLAGQVLNTTYGNEGWLTAVVPSDLYARDGRFPVRVVNPDGQESNSLWFDVAP